MSLTLLGFLNLTVAMIDHIVINSKTQVKVLHLRAVLISVLKDLKRAEISC